MPLGLQELWGGPPVRGRHLLERWLCPRGTRADRVADRGSAPQFLRNSQNWKNEFDDDPDNPKRQRGMRCRRFACRSQMPHSTARYPKRTNSLKRLSTLLMSHTEICTTMQVDVP